MTGMRLQQFLFALVVSGLTGSAVSSTSPDLINNSASNTTAMEQLLKGEVVVQNARTEQSGGSIRVQALMHTDLKSIWDFIASCDSVFLYVQGIRSCSVLSIESGPDEDVTVLHQSVKKSWIIPTIEYTLSVKRMPPDRVDFKLVEGDLKAMEGGWRFKQMDDGAGILVTHEIRIKPSFPVPRWLIRRSMRDDIPDMMACLRGLVDGSGNSTKDSDLGRCPKVKARNRRDRQSR
jgi:ribosome-associated toxin RatA of RatAB toxin-antitoxin module